MTTNFTHIINENADMFEEFDIRIEEELKMEYARQCAMESRYDEEEDEEFTCFIDGKPVSDGEFLAHLRAKLRELAEKHGEDSDEFRDEWSFYSDVYKDIHGMRPHWLPMW